MQSAPWRDASSAAASPIIPASQFPKQTIHPQPLLPLSRRSQIFPITAPTITLQSIAFFDQSGPNGILMYIVTHRPQIKIIRAIHQQGFVASRKQMYPHPVPRIVALGICSHKPLHSSDQPRFWRFHDDVKMIFHQSIRMDLPFCLLTRLAQRFEKSFSVLAILKDRLFSIPSAHHVIDRSVVFNPQLPRHPFSFLHSHPLGNEE